MNASLRRLSAALALAFLPTLATAGPQSLGQRELSGRDNRFIEIPAGHPDAGFRAMAPGKRIVFDASGVRMGLSSPRLAKSTNGTATLRYAFEGGARVAPQGVRPSPTVYHWFVGDRSEWLTNLKSYGALAYRGVWPGVDAVFAGDAGGFKYQFELAAGAKPGAVALVVEGADSVRVNEAGALEWRIGGEQVVDDAPLAFQPSGEGHSTVAAAYLVDKVGTNAWRVRFTVGDYDTSKALIIDPAWTGFSGLVGGSAADQVYAVARDASANTYACGVTASANMPSLPAGTSKAAGDDAFFVKFDSAGVAQVVAYVGGSGSESCNGIAADAAGRIYLAGGTTSTDFPTAGTDGSGRFRRLKSSDRDAFVMRFAASGAAIDYAGFIGGSEDDQANAIAVDSSNRAYVTGFSVCTAQPGPGCTNGALPFPVLGGPRTTHGGDALGTGGMDAFVARVDANGGTLEYAGFIGGDGGAEMGNAIAVGADFSAYVAGATDAATGLASPGGFRTAVNSRAADASDGFVAKVAPTGASLAYFTLLTGTAPSSGESGADRAFAIALESDGTVVVAGETDSQNFPANDAGTRSGSGPQTVGATGMDGFVLRLNAAGTAVDSATYLGGPGHDSAEAVATDGTSLFVTGTTSNGTGFPTAPQAGVVTAPPGGQDAFLAKIDRGAPGAFSYSGFLGTAANETVRALAASVVGGYTILSAGGATTTGGTAGLTNPTTGALGSSGAANGLVLRINPFGPPASVTVQAGSSPQSTPIDTAFANALTVLVQDVSLQPLAGITVTFTPPGSGASAALAPSTTAVTDASGLASVNATANGLAGAYSVNAAAGAASTTISLTNLKGDQAISFAALADRTMLQTPFTVAATATSGLAVAFSSTTTAVCTVSGTSVTLVAAGTCEIAADQPGDTNYNPAPQVKRSFLVTQVAQTITFDPLADRSLAQTPFTVAATASSGLPVAFTSLTAPVCTVAGTTVTLVSAGVCTLAADQAGNATYSAAPQVQRSFNVTTLAQTITFNALAGRTFGDAPFGVSATASSGLAVTFSSLTGLVCTVAGGTVTIVAAGNCSIAADQAGNATYGPAPRVTQTFAVAKAAQAIAFGALPGRTYGDAPFTVSATGGASGNAVTFSAAPGGPCSVAGNTVTILAAGTCTVAADQAGNANYEAAPQVTRAFPVAQAAQVITFDPLPGRTFGDAAFTVSATGGGSGNAVVFLSLTGGTCSVAGTTVAITGAGDCTISANQAGSANFLPAVQVTRTFAIARAPQSISFAALAARTMADGPFGVSATASSGLGVVFSPASPAACAVSGNSVSPVAPGVCSVVATQPGNADFLPAAPVTQAFYLLPADPAADSDADGIPDPIDLAEGLNPFAKDNDVFTSARLFAMQQYRDFLGREADPGGLATYTAIIQPGPATRAGVIGAFLNSPEFHDAVSPVVRLYFAAFLRIPDYAGLTFQVNAFRAGTLLAAIANNFASSPEFLALYGATTDAQYVALLYQNVLGRAASQPEIDYHVARLAGGATRGEVMLGFTESAEYVALKENAVNVTMMYVGMLHRAPEQAGFDYWVAYLGAGSSANDMVLGFLAAAEYRNRFLP